MGANTFIPWCDHTYNHWIGCEAVSPACAHCYAKVLVEGRMGRERFEDRKLTGKFNRKWPEKWNRDHDHFFKVHGRRQRVFCMSLADVFDNQVPDEWRVELFAKIKASPNLDWLLLTKRIGNAKRMLPADWGEGYPNVWLGISVCNQEEADRDVPKLLATPARIRFLSCEPQLGPIDLRRIRLGPDLFLDARFGTHEGHWTVGPLPEVKPSLDWVITGGESGAKKDARPYDIAWARSLLAQCRAAGVACFIKQLGTMAHDGVYSDSDIVLGGKGIPRPTNQPLSEEKAREIVRHLGGPSAFRRWLPLRDRKGEDINEFPEDLRVREWPRSAA